MQINDNNRKCFGHIFKITDDDDAGLKAVFVEAFQSLPDCFGFFSFVRLHQRVFCPLLLFQGDRGETGPLGPAGFAGPPVSNTAELSALQSQRP